jgi:hypothetical protein
VNPLVEQYVRHAKRFGDPHTVYETAERDSLLAAADLGWLAAQLRRLDPSREACRYRDGNGRLVSEPKFKLTERQKDRLGRRLTDGIAAKTVTTYIGSTPRWVKERTPYWRAVSEWTILLGRIDIGYGPPPVDLADTANVDGSLYRALSTVIGLGSNSSESTRDRLSTSGIGGEIVTVGLRFDRLEVVRIERDGSGRRVAVCRCDCGNETSAKPSHLVRGEKRSCGCLRRERMAEMKHRREQVAT